MRKHTRMPALIIAMTMTAGAASLMVQGQTKPKQSKQSVLALRRQDEHASSPSQKEAREQLPIADAFPSATAEDPKEKEKRQKRNARHNNERSEPITEAPYPLTSIDNSHWWQSLPAIPVTQSDVILVGDVSDAQAFLSNDRTGIYSEFTISVGEVLKNNGSSLGAGVEIQVERSGGAVRFPSGAIQKYVTSDQNMPLVGRTYVVFLKRIDDQDYSIVTAYELLGQHVLPLDGSSNANGSRLPFDVYKGSDATSFLEIVRNSIGKKEESL